MRKRPSSPVRFVHATNGGRVLHVLNAEHYTTDYLLTLCGGSIASHGHVSKTGRVTKARVVLDPGHSPLPTCGRCVGRLP